MEEKTTFFQKKTRPPRKTISITQRAPFSLRRWAIQPPQTFWVPLACLKQWSCGLKGDFQRNLYAQRWRKEINVGEEWREEETIEKKRRMCCDTCTNYKKSANTCLQVKSDFEPVDLGFEDWCSTHKPNGYST